MKKVWAASVAVMLLTACQTGTLDTSKLERISEEAEQTGPVSYAATSTEEAVAALPFSVKLPSELPFEAEPFQTTLLQDVEGNLKTVRAEFTTVSVNQDAREVITITVSNEKIEVNGKAESVDLGNGVKGQYSGSLLFKKDGVYYSIGRIGKSGDNKGILVQIAKQMI